MSKRVLLIGSEGYVGAKLTPALRHEADINLDCCDSLWFTEVAPYIYYNCDFNDLKKVSLSRYDAIILLAGHSSVGMSKDRAGAFNNNVRNFVNLLEKIGDIPLIYASSASVYGHGEKQFFEYDPLPPASNWYDFTKQEIDRIALLSKQNTYGLRFGTVCGASPNQRVDVIANSMFLSARNTGVVRMANPKALRAILGIDDLVRAVVAILKYIDEKGPKNTGIYNLASFNDTIEHMANYVTGYMGATLQEVPPSPTYSFMLNVQKFQQVFDWAPQQELEQILYDLSQNCAMIPEEKRSYYSRERAVAYV
jgi:nucleoside-diphosphate-sugar epimerase